MKNIIRALRRFLLSNVFIRLVWLILIICLLVLVFKGIMVTHKSAKTPYTNPITEKYGIK